MKRILFTFLAMVALVLMANTTFGQSTPAAPFVGATETYTVGGLTDADGLTWHVTSDTISTTNSPVGSVGISGDANASSGSASVDVTWDGVTAGTTYYLWIAVTDADGGNCTNYRYVPITPAANTWDVTLAAIAIADTTTVPTLSNTFAYNNADSTDACAVIDPNTVNYDASETYATVDDGETWVYYRINRVDGTTANDWNFYFATGGTTTNIQESADGTSWSDIAGSTPYTINVTEDQNVYYIRVGYSASTSSQEITAYIDGTGGTGTQPNEAVSLLDDSDNANNDVTVTINPIPAVGGFTGF